MQYEVKTTTDAVIALLLRNAVVKQMRARGVEGELKQMFEKDEVVYVRIGDQTVEVDMTNSIQALWSSCKGSQSAE